VKKDSWIIPFYKLHACAFAPDLPTPTDDHWA
jgi:hypothetical protein